MNISNKKTFTIIVLCFMLVLMGTGYAILSSKLNVSGTNSMVGKWDIHIKEITTNVNGLASSSSVEIYTDKLGAYLVLDLYEDGDYVEYNIVVENAGNIPAKLTDFFMDNYSASPYIVVTDTVPLNEQIAANSTSTFTIKFELDVPEGEIVEEVYGNYYEFFLTYVQDTGVTK